MSKDYPRTGWGLRHPALTELLAVTKAAAVILFQQYQRPLGRDGRGVAPHFRSGPEPTGIRSL